MNWREAAGGGGAQLPDCLRAEWFGTICALVGAGADLYLFSFPSLLRSLARSSSFLELPLAPPLPPPLQDDARPKITAIIIIIIIIIGLHDDEDASRRPARDADHLQAARLARAICCEIRSVSAVVVLRRLLRCHWSRRRGTRRRRLATGVRAKKSSTTFTSCARIRIIWPRQPGW